MAVSMLSYWLTDRYLLWHAYAYEYFGLLLVPRGEFGHKYQEKTEQESSPHACNVGTNPPRNSYVTWC